MAERYTKQIAIPLLQGTIRVLHCEVKAAWFIIIFDLTDDLRGMQVGMILLDYASSVEESQLGLCNQIMTRTWTRRSFSPKEVQQIFPDDLKNQEKQLSMSRAYIPSSSAKKDSEPYYSLESWLDSASTRLHSKAHSEVRSLSTQANFLRHASMTSQVFAPGRLHQPLIVRAIARAKYSFS